MEVAAGFAEHVDVQAGRVVDEIDRLGYGDNTLVFYSWGDNGSSAEGASTSASRSDRRFRSTIATRRRSSSTAQLSRFT
jgi:arylsulfatase A-like enzyme